MKMGDFSQVRGLGSQMLIGVDSKSKPGTIICHFVRMETIAFENDGTFDTTTFEMASAENDPRFAMVVEAIRMGGR